MANQQLLDYIKQQMQSGSQDEEIRHILLAKGWSIEDINEAFLLSAGPRTFSTLSALRSYSSPTESSKEGNISLTKTSTPIMVSIIGWLMFLGGILKLLATGTQLMMFGGFLIFSRLSLLSLILIIVAGLGLVQGTGWIVLSFGIRRMRRWALYVLTILTVIGVIGTLYLFLVSSKQNATTYADVVIQAVAVMYLWSVEDRFN